MKNKLALLLMTGEGIFSLVFFILFIVAIISVAKGAWWHIITAVSSFVICDFLAEEIKNRD